MRALPLLVLLSLAWCSCEGNYKGHRVVSVQASTREDLDYLAGLQGNPELDFWTDPSLIRPTDIRVPPNQYGKLRRDLAAANLPFQLIHDNVQELVDEERRARWEFKTNISLYPAQCDYTQEYCTMEEIYAMMWNLQDQYPANVEIIPIGASNESRMLQAVKIAEDLNNPKQAIWIEAGTHAREWIAISSAVYLINELAMNVDIKANEMLANFDWYIIPVHNPDGYIYSHINSNTRLWRKNRQPCGDGNIGKDLNRNWDVDFGKVSTDKTCAGNLWPGEEPFSTPETSALRDAVLSTDNVLAYFSVHAYSQLMLVPFAYTSTKPDRYEELRSVAQNMMDELYQEARKRFRVGTAPDLLYAASGGSDDFFYLQGIPYSYTYELRPSNNAQGGFLLSPSNIGPSGRELFRSLWSFAHQNPARPAGW